MTKVKVVEDVYWVGVEDWDLRNFHGYRTPTEPHTINIIATAHGVIWRSDPKKIVQV